MTKPTNHPQWRRSSRCTAANCVEVAWDGDFVLVRDSKDPAAAPLKFTRSEWFTFKAGMQEGEFDFG